MKEILYYLTGIIMGTLGSHYVGDPLIGLCVSSIIFFIIAIMMLIKRFSKRGKDE